MAVTSWTNIEQEAKAFRKKQTPKSLKPLTSRRYLAGQALAGLLARGRGFVNKADMKREAFEWADYMLEDDY